MYQKEYQSKKLSIEQVLSNINAGDCIVFGAYGNEPVLLMRQLHKIAPRVQGVTAWCNMIKEDYPFVMDTTLNGRIDIASNFYGSQHRRLHGSRRMGYVPADLRNMAKIMLGRQKPRVLFCAASPMDEEGYFSLSSLSYEAEMLEEAELIFLEVNPRQPRCFGKARVHISRVAGLYKSDEELFYTGTIPVSETEQQIGENVASLIHDGDTLQFGVGSMPECVGAAMYKHKDMGIHTELLSNALAELIERGIVNNSRKNFHQGKTVAAFMWGSKHMYELMNGREDLELLPGSYVNHPYIASRNDNLVSVNAALQIDLTGQICSESIGSRQYSGSGGAFDFACGAFESKGGRGIIAIRSTAKNDTVSKIQFQLTPGSAVSISRNVVDYVVTEYGIAKLSGATIRERALRLINVAHPAFRGELTKQAHDLLLW